MKKYYAVTLIFLLMIAFVYADYTVNFEGTGETKTGYATATVNLSGLNWDLTQALIGTSPADFKNGARSARLLGSSTTFVTMLQNKSNGIGTISFYYRRYGTDTQVPWVVEYSTNDGGTWTQIGDAFTAPGTDVPQLFSNTLNVSGDVRIRIYSTITTTSTNRRLNIDDISMTDFIGYTPTLTPDSGTLTGFAYVAGSGPSTSQSYQLSGTHLSPASGNITVSGSTSFEVSLNNSVFASQVTIPYSSETLSNTYVYVRLKAGLTVGTFVESIGNNGGGASASITVSGSITPSPEGNASDLFISEYVEGSSYCKAIEIFNGTGAPVNLGNYAIRKQTNGVDDFENTLTLSGTLADRDVYVVVYAQIGGTNLVGNAYVDLATTTLAMSFNGNDAMAIYKNGVQLDVVGVIGSSAYWGADVTMVRNSSIDSPSTAYSLSDWTSYPNDTFSYLGSHQFDGTSSEVLAPTLQASNLVLYPGNQSIGIEWTPGNGSKRIVVINTTNSFSSPADGIDPSANTVYSGSGEQVIYNGSTEIIEGLPFNGVTVTGLTTATTYWVRVYECNGSGASIKYLTTTASGNPLSATTTNSQSNAYYDGIIGYGTSLKSSLHTLLRTTHTTRYSYDALWTQLPYTDEDPNNTNNVIEIYTGWSVPKTLYGTIVTGWNREHTWSKSHGDFGETVPAGTDLHHLRPCDVTVNSAKGNKDFDNGGTLYTDASPYPGYSGNTGNYTSTYAWEPRTEDKGDVARMIMYMAVRYEGTDTTYDLEIVDDTNTSGPNYGKLSTLLQWHVSDPPDAREMQRNNRIQERQGNRNPFIDEPQYAQYIWTPVPAAATNISSTGFTINWTTPITATNYYLDVATDNNFTSFVSGYSNYDADLNTSKTITGLNPGTTYYYRLRSYFTSGYSMYSPVGSVSLSTPPTAIAATAIARDGFTARWMPVSGATSYQFDVLSNGGTQYVSGYQNAAVTETFFRVSNLDANTTYTYVVRAVNTNGASLNSNTISVTTTDVIAGESANTASGGDPVLLDIIAVQGASVPTMTNNNVEIEPVGIGVYDYSLQVSYHADGYDTIPAACMLYSVTASSVVAYNATYTLYHEGLGFVPAAVYYRYGGTWNLLATESYTSTLNSTILNIDGIAKALKGELDIVLGGGESTLPVELSSFTSAITANNLVAIKWVTESETNCWGYQIYRGNTESLAEATKISGMIAAVNTSVQQSYWFVDSELQQSGDYYYWLESVDINGANHYFGALSVHAIFESPNTTPQLPLQTGISAIYPNPFNPRTYISYDLASLADVNIKIYNLRGQVVRSLISRQQAPGRYRIEWNGTSDAGAACGNGIYYISMRANREVYLRKVVLQK
ncbi:MAG: ribonuclease [Candidatus Cloacimonetes bacterium HGW-Cloacimonetes-1]|jgi:endonuclease I|nr:MAG: ribonuclease [Candidatus Cloacimonetes bacterium HGW-Cloacimonetes-1]